MFTRILTDRSLKLDDPSNTTTTSICNPTEGDAETRKQAKKEFCDFVMATFNELYRIESRCIGGKSTISVVCRMDIGVVVEPKTKKVGYFVNEVERTATTSLWANGGSLPIGTFGTTLAKEFYAWLAHVTYP
jgi:hypothetical protein